MSAQLTSAANQKPLMTWLEAEPRGQVRLLATGPGRAPESALAGRVLGKTDNGLLEDASRFDLPEAEPTTHLEGISPERVKIVGTFTITSEHLDTDAKQVYLRLTKNPLRLRCPVTLWEHNRIVAAVPDELVEIMGKSAQQGRIFVSVIKAEYSRDIVVLPHAELAVVALSVDKQVVDCTGTADISARIENIGRSEALGGRFLLHYRDDSRGIDEILEQAHFMALRPGEYFTLKARVEIPHFGHWFATTGGLSSTTSATSGAYQQFVLAAFILAEDVAGTVSHPTTSPRSDSMTGVVLYLPAGSTTDPACLF